MKLQWIIGTWGWSKYTKIEEVLQEIYGKEVGTIIVGKGSSW